MTAPRSSSWARHTPRELANVEQVREILGTDPELIGANLTKTAVLEHLEKLETGSAGQSLMFYWAGHGESNGGLALITSDDDRPRGKISAHEVVKSALESQAGQQLYVLTSQAGALECS